MSVATYFWRIKLVWYIIRTLRVLWYVYEGLDYFGTKFVLYEFPDTLLTDYTILVQNSHCLNFEPYFWKIGLFWYKIRTLWISRHILDWLDYFGTKFVLYECRDIFLTNETILVQNSYFMSVVTFSWRMRLFWYKIRTLWLSWHISDG